MPSRREAWTGNCRSGVTPQTANIWTRPVSARLVEVSVITIGLIFLTLVPLPIVIASAFRKVLIERKSKRLKQEISELAAQQIFKSVDDGNGIQDDVERFFSKARLLPPAGILTFMYLLSFWIAYAYLTFRFPGWIKPAHEFPEYLLRNAGGLSVAFLGVYTFNLGAIVRRLYLVDLTEHVFWSAINRYVVTMGIAIIFGLAGLTSAGQKSVYVPWVYFSIGFLASFFLDAILDRAADASGLFNRSASKAPEYPLELIRGIDLWKSYRFEEEGIESVQNLATADLRALAIKTRYPIKTLADWMDQAILIHRLGDKATKLWGHGIEGSAIELASRSPANNGNNAESRADAANIAKALELGDEQSNIEHLMDSLFWDESVRTLWRVWQKRDDWTGGTQVANASDDGALSTSRVETVARSETRVAGVPAQLTVTAVSSQGPAQPTGGAK